MRQEPVPVVKDLVLVGGGHSHVTVLRRFGMRPLPGVRVTVIARERHAPYSGMLPGLIAGHYDFDDAHIDLGPLSRFAGARLIHAEVVGLDLAAKRVRCGGRPPIAYDVLAIDTGSTPAMEDVPGAADVVIPVKPIDRFLAHWEALRARCLGSGADVHLGVVGGGAGGVELLLAVQHRLRTELAANGDRPERLHAHLVTDTPEILPTHNVGLRARFMRVLARRGVDVVVGARVVRVSPGCLHLADGVTLALDEILWVTAAGAPPWPRAAGLAVDDRGFIAVHPTLQSVSHPDVFASGDVAAVAAHPRPKSGVFAVRQGKPLERNLRRRLRGRALAPFTPQTRFLSLISTGDRVAVASRGGWAFGGRAVWWWKRWIDRRFVRRYTRLPAMPVPPGPRIDPALADDAVRADLATASMRCGGCAAKIGSDVLDRVLARVRAAPPAGVVVGLDAPDDAAVIVPPPDRLLVQSVDFFRAFVDDPYVFGQIAANHALADVLAMGADPHTALAIVTVPFAPDAKVEELLTQVMAGAVTALGRDGAALVGGHSTEGSELALGFAVQGVVARDAVLTKGGMRPGDRVLLTKALGTGALFAADMRAAAKGRWIGAALTAMVQSNRDGARCLARHGATAMTDVSGFGLIGHLVEMARASGVEVVLAPGAVPALPGALDVLARGLVSSLQRANLRARHAVRALGAVDDPRIALLFDPQTAGGLLASVPPAHADACVAELRALGYAASAVIGTVRAATAADVWVSLDV
jgi:selenide,water dikinase